MKIETERLILHDFVKDDWKRVLEYQTDPLYLHYYEWTERTPQDVQDFVDRMISFQEQEPRIKYQMAIKLKWNNLLIGNCGIRMDKSGAVEADIGYEFDPKQWNRGYATEATHTIVDFGFTDFDLHRVWAHCVEGNLGSAHVLEKLGMKLEGRLREQEFYKGKWWNKLIYGILEDEWEIHKQSHPVQWRKIND